MASLSLSLSLSPANSLPAPSYKDNLGIMENKMEAIIIGNIGTAIMGYIGAQRKMEATI